MHSLQLLVVLVACVLVKGDGHGTPKVVTTPAGQIQGYFKTEPMYNLSLTYFKGIPYGKPPVGDLRFKKSVAADRFTSVFDAKDFGPACIQIKEKRADTESEDCLSLDVYVPGIFENRGSSKAVIVYIGGYGFTEANKTLQPGPWLAGAHDVITVTFNYRLGLFGFMSNENGSIPGNMGLMDQVLALKWVKDNIAAFGGDVNKITIMGESAGAESVFYHLMSPLSKALFNRAILQSTPQMGPVERKYQAGMLKDIFKEMCKAEILIPCIMKLSKEDIIKAAFMAQMMYFPNIIVDKEFLTKEPGEMLMEGDFDASKEVIVGYSSGDGAIMVKYAIMSHMAMEMMKHEDHMHMPSEEEVKEKVEEIMTQGLDKHEQLEHMIGSALYYHGWSEMPNGYIMGNLLYQQYISCSHGKPIGHLRGVIDMFTDSVFTSPLFMFASIYSMKGGKVYMYEFKHLYSGLAMSMKYNKELALGATHGTLKLFLAQKVYEWGGSDAEKMLTDSISVGITTFAKTGEPYFMTVGNSPTAIKWEPYTYTDMKYVQFSGMMTDKSLMMVPEKLMKRVSMWNYVLKGIQTMDTCMGYEPSPKPPVAKGATLSILSLINVLVVALAALFIPRKM